MSGYAEIHIHGQDIVSLDFETRLPDPNEAPSEGLLRLVVKRPGGPPQMLVFAARLIQAPWQEVRLESVSLVTQPLRPEWTVELQPEDVTKGTQTDT